jgi:hypothetical protein
MSSPSRMNARDSLSIDVVFEDEDEPTEAPPSSTPTILAYFSAYPRVTKAQLPAPPMLPAIETFEPRLPASSIPLPLLRRPSAAMFPSLRHAPLGRWRQSVESDTTIPAPRFSRAA